ncbi:hypothetical protein D3C79_631930 [compost metagenome]
MAGVVADVAVLAIEGGDVDHELRAQAAIGEAQVALLGAHLIDEDARGGTLAGLVTRPGQQQLLDVGDPLLTDLDTGEGLAQQYVVDLQLLAHAVIVQPAQLQPFNL